MNRASSQWRRLGLSSCEPVECQIKPHLECHLRSSLSQCQCIDGCKCAVCPDQSRALGRGLLDRCGEGLAQVASGKQAKGGQALRAQPVLWGCWGTPYHTVLLQILWGVWSSAYQICFQSVRPCRETVTGHLAYRQMFYSKNKALIYALSACLGSMV